ncbi:aminotransferase class IV [Altererythrobacter sp. ZODW24]|uniref:aminotransferase class IV n=1 Tax=Altererythrobacter sp. ZODW24 TaxID=2185142 RepID=UPI000DF7A662|nr:aminotransferase class IV [Altererythrobacter sp. ZODW24]
MAGSQDFADDPRNADLRVLLNGELVPSREAKVSIFDAGFGLGDGVWEGLRLHKGSLLFLNAHLDRLYSGADQIRLDIGQTQGELKADLLRLLEANRMQDGGHLRLMVTRGPKASINQDPRFSLGKPTIACTAEFKVPPKETSRGLNLKTVSIRTSGPEMFDMHLNSHSRLNYILALLEAIDGEADEALMLDPHGNIASCNATNFFWVRNGTVFTSGDTYCFNGITRMNIIDACRAGAATLKQGHFSPEHVTSADEAFVTGTMGGVTPVRSIDGRELDENGPVTQLMAETYARMKDDYAKEHPFV